MRCPIPLMGDSGAERTGKRLGEEENALRKSFDSDWRFKLGDIEGGQSPDLDDSQWRTLNVPHDWSIEGEYAAKNATGRRCGFLLAGIGWYRKRFEIPEEWTDKQIYIDFDGIYMNSEVWINGHYLGKRPYGYISFRYELSAHIKAGQNVIAVRVDNEKNPSSRWYNGAGIYRHTWLCVKNKIHLAEHEIFAYTPHINEKAACLKVAFGVENLEDRDVCTEVEIYLRDKAGLVIGKAVQTVKVGAGGLEKGCGEVDVQAPELWSPDAPALYDIEILLKTDNKIIDQESLKTGLRFFQFDPDTGFYLNGKNTKFRGVCLHHDAGPLGAAVPDKVLETRLMQLKEMGCNAIRTAHNPFAPEFYDMCDRIGIMVMDEIFDGWHKKAEYDYGALYFDEWWQKDVTDFVCRDRNHPSVMIWSIGNETGREDIHGIGDLFRRLDPTRPVTGGQMLYGVDIAGFNGPSESPGVLEEMKMQQPGCKIILTEVPHTYQTRGFYRTKTWWRDYKKPRYDIPDLTKEELFDDYAARYSHTVTYNSSYDNAAVRISNHDAWRRTRDMAYIAGQFQWTGFDYLGESFGWPFKSGNNGILDLCGFPKDIYYFYKSQWTAGPVLHILPHWTHPGKEGAAIPVWVYSNCETVELFLNGRSAGRQKTAGNMKLRWDISYTPGVLEAVGEKQGQKIVSTVKTADSPAAVSLSGDTDNLKAGGIDIAQITASVVDAAGNFVPYADNRIYFHVHGTAALKAVGNGDPADVESHRKNSRKAFYGLCKAFVQSDMREEGAVLIAAGIMGQTYFEEKTEVRICCSQIAVQQGQEIEEPRVYYTVDGTTPDTGSKEYNAPFTVDTGTTVKALLIFKEQSWVMEQVFVKGRKTDEAFQSLIPRSKNIVGQWESDKGERYDFHANGDVDVFTGSEKTGTYGWWYEDPVDPFENEEGAIDNGEINFTWHAAKLRLTQPGTLRMKNRHGIEILKRK